MMRKVSRLISVVLNDNDFGYIYFLISYKKYTILLITGINVQMLGGWSITIILLHCYAYLLYLDKIV